MITNSRMVYLIIYVSNLERSRDFYERKLGLRVIEEDADSVKYDGGQTIIMLNRAGDYGIELPEPPDESAQIVFLVGDIDRTQRGLEERGVAFSGGMKYEVGAVADFYDPDGHHLVLYEASTKALGWSSGPKVEALWKATVGSESDVPIFGSRSANGAGHPPDVTVELDGRPLVYLFLFVTDSDVTEQFYAGTLGLTPLEGGPCSRSSGGDEDGVVKYDTGGIMLTTHHLDTTRGPIVYDGHVCPPRDFDPTRARGVAPVFQVVGINGVVNELSRKGVGFQNGVRQLSVGRIARFEDPSGHLLFLYEPSDEALGWPSGEKIRQILAAPL